MQKDNYGIAGKGERGIVRFLQFWRQEMLRIELRDQANNGVQSSTMEVRIELRTIRCLREKLKSALRAPQQAERTL
jgi:hypothetical protein